LCFAISRLNNEAADQYLAAAQTYHLEKSNETGKTLSAYAEEKSQQKARRYNTIIKKQKRRK